MVRLSEADHIALMNAIASREGTASQISKWYAVPIEQLRKFVRKHEKELTRLREELEANEREYQRDSGIVSVAELDNLWISKKIERLQRLQNIADVLYEEAKRNPSDSTALREFRSYCAAVANELGQLLHRGAGESGSDALNVDIQGVDMDKLK
jgi:hypothetical protein